VAANMVQFIVYGINIVSKGNQLYKSTDGALIENVELQEATIRLQQLSRNFDKSLDQSLSQGLRAQNDESIQKICDECKAVSKELVEKLERLKVPEGHPHKKWKSFRQALKSIWTKERIEDIAQRLSQLRIELDSHVLVSLRYSSSPI
jgi:flagellar motility protein MotE (MotC chaperone)